MAKDKIDPATHDYLIDGEKHLKSKQDFKLVGRDDELRRLTKALTRHRSSSVLLVGPGGVGCSTLCLGLQASKENDNAPLDVVSKRMFWLDTDGLFSSGNTSQINEAFQRAMKTLSRSKGDAVLVIDDMRDFIDAANSNGCSNLVNMLMREIKQGKFQAILESDDDDIDVVLRCHSDMKESFTLIDVAQPDEESLALIMKEAAKDLERHHKIKISEEAIAMAIEMTTKFPGARDLGLSRAQPERSVTLLDRSLTTYRLNAHSRDPRLDELEQRLASVNVNLADDNYSEEQGGKTKAELEQLRASLEQDIQDVLNEWDERQKEIKSVYADLRDSEEEIRKYEDRRAEQILKENERRQERLRLEEEKGIASDKPSVTQNTRSDEVTRIDDKIREFQGYVKDAKMRFDELTADINGTLELTSKHVLTEFSAISGIPAGKLTQDEKEILLNLDGNLKKRVFGQDEAVEKLAAQVRVARAGLRRKGKPQAAFMYLGPSGVGKTELAKALSAELLGGEAALTRFDMGEYMEKHSVAKLIGSPPGYEGYEAGGILTNAMRRNPRRIILFDEIEKAHPSVFDTFLQILDDARLTDNHGRTVFFDEAIIIMTTNVGTPHFLNEPDFDVAKEKAKDDLLEKYRVEFLNRFAGQKGIVCFNKLKLPIIQMIAAREIHKLNALVEDKGITLDIDPQALESMCEKHYEPEHGARGIIGYIEDEITPAIADTILFDDEAKGVMMIDYDPDQDKVTVHPPKLEEPKAAEAEVSPTAAAAKEFGADTNQPS